MYKETKILNTKAEGKGRERREEDVSSWRSEHTSKKPIRSKASQKLIHVMA